MINANELRIGNWVKPHPEADYRIQVTSINKEGVSLYAFAQDIDEYEVGAEFEFDKLEPIPLTPEILEKAGFKEQRQTFFTWYIIGSKENQFRLDYSDEETYHWVEGHRSVALNYLHQLQNLYFALTRNELEIKL